MAAEITVERDLFANPDEWISNKGDSINKPPSAYFEASAGPEGMLLTNGLLEAWSGALVSHTRQPPTDSKGKLMNWIAFRFEFRIHGVTAKNLARLETDLKVCVKTRPTSTTYIRSVANFSTQINRDNWQFQIDKDPPQWVNTGFVVSDEDLAPDVWHTLEYRWWFDDVALVFSVLSIQLDRKLYMIPDHLQRVPMSETNWEKCRKLQLQNEGYEDKSTVLIDYKNGELAWSNERIPMIPPISSVRSGREDEGEEQFERGDWRNWAVSMK